MNSGLGRILIGCVFLFLGISRITQDEGNLVYFGYAMAGYGLFSVGFGAYKMMNKDKEDSEETR